MALSFKNKMVFYTKDCELRKEIVEKKKERKKAVKKKVDKVEANQSQYDSRGRIGQ